MRIHYSVKLAVLIALLSITSSAFSQSIIGTWRSIEEKDGIASSYYCFKSNNVAEIVFRGVNNDLENGVDYDLTIILPGLYRLEGNIIKTDFFLNRIDVKFNKILYKGKPYEKEFLPIMREMAIKMFKNTLGIDKVSIDKLSLSWQLIKCTTNRLTLYDQDKGKETICKRVKRNF